MNEREKLADRIDDYLGQIKQARGRGQEHTALSLEMTLAGIIRNQRDLIISALRASPSAEGGEVGRLAPDQVEWVVNDIAELGVKIGNQFFWLYKGHSLVYGDDEKSQKAGVSLNEDTDPPTQHMWRPVFKREFGECAHPINQTGPTLIGTVSLDDSDEWKPLPPALSARPATEAQTIERCAKVAEKTGAEFTSATVVTEEIAKAIRALAHSAADCAGGE